MPPSFCRTGISAMLQVQVTSGTDRTHKRVCRLGQTAITTWTTENKSLLCGRLFWRTAQACGPEEPLVMGRGGVPVPDFTRCVQKLNPPRRDERDKVGQPRRSVTYSG